MSVATDVREGVGARARRVDGEEKVTGAFLYGSDLVADDMLWGVTVRSPHASARIVRVDTSRARGYDGVAAVLTAADLPARKTFGLEFCDQPVLADDVVRYAGEPVAVVAAETLEQARSAAAAIDVEYEPLAPVTDMEAALADDAPRVHAFGNVLRHVHILRGDPDGAHADVWVDGYYETAMQDQAALGPEGGLARHPRRRRRDRGDLAVAARRPAADRALPRPPGGEGTPDARRRRRRVRVARGPAHADPRRAGRAAHGPAGEDGVRPRGVVPRSRAPPPVADLDSLRRDARRPPRRRRRTAAARRRRIRVLLARGARERVDVRVRPVRGGERVHRGHRRLHEQPAVRGDAGLRRPPGLLRIRVGDRCARGEARARPRRAAAAKRAPHRLRPADGAGRDGHRAGARGARALRRAAAA